MIRSLILIVSAVFVFAAPVDDEAWLTRGAEILQPFKQNLQAELQQGLSRGPRHAIEVCRLRAPELAKAAGSETVRIGRTSHKLRNPANEPHDWMKPLVDHYLSSPDDKQPRLVHLDDGRVGYVEPIFVQWKCLICHGESIAPAIQDELKRQYPQDQATGFREGDFRGLFWVEFSE